MQLAIPHRLSPTLPPATAIGDWTVGDVIGRGASSTVYEASHRATRVCGALKVVDVDLRRRSDLRLRHAREIEVLASIDSPHVPRVLDAGDLPDGSPYVVMERIDGETLDELLTRRRLSVREVYHLARELLHAVAAVHRRGVVHRDLKPANVVLESRPDGTLGVGLIDFGICLPQGALRVHARLTRDDVLLGSACYVAPEQLQGQEADERADLYSVGAILHECLTGRPPFDGDTWGAVAIRVLQEDAPSPTAQRPDCPERLARLVEIALSRDPAARFRSAVEMLGGLEDVRSGELPVRPEEHADLVQPSRPATYGEAIGWTPMVLLAFGIAVVATLVALFLV